MEWWEDVEGWIGLKKAKIMIEKEGRVTCEKGQVWDEEPS